MNARRLARWALRAALVGVLAVGAVYTAHAASASDQPEVKPPGTVYEQQNDGAAWE